MNDIYDILEACLQGLENGADLETLLSRYPEHAHELRPILEASVHARKLASTPPSADLIHRGRAKFMQRAAELREGKVTPRPRVIPALQRLAISFALTALFLTSGTGLVRASSSALPGEKLYPVKRSWEGLRLFFTFDHNKRAFLENEFESERLEEVGHLISEGRHETIQFAGVFMQVNGAMYVSGLPILITENTQLPAQVVENGAAVIVTGRTNVDGIVEVESLALLPAGSVVPLGTPIELETESESEDGSGPSSSGTGSGSGNEAQGDDSGRENESSLTIFQMEGIVDAFSSDTIVVNGQTGYLNEARIEGEVQPGAKVEVEGYYAPDGKFIVTKVKVEDTNSGSGNDEDNSGTGSDSNSGSDSESDDGDDDHSGSGGGGEDEGDDDD